MAQFKDMDAFEDFQKKVGEEIAGTFVGRLKEYGVSESQLGQLSEDICYDIASAMVTIGAFEIPDVNHVNTTTLEQAFTAPEKKPASSPQPVAQASEPRAPAAKAAPADSAKQGLEAVIAASQQARADREKVVDAAPDHHELDFMEDTTDEIEVELSESSKQGLAALEASTQIRAEKEEQAALSINDLDFMEDDAPELSQHEPEVENLSLIAESEKDLELPDPSVATMAFLEENIDDKWVNEDSEKNPATSAVKGVMSQDQILKVLNAAKTASA